jgi:MFS family permease
MLVILLAQIQMGFNVNAIPISVGPIVEELGLPATSVGTALVVYSLFVAAFVMLGAKLGALLGARLMFQLTAVMHGAAMAMMALSVDERAMTNAQALAGLAAAALVPTLVVLIAANYRGGQQAQALGLLAGAPAVSGVLAFLLAGFLGTALSWRYSFGLLFFVSLVVLGLSFRLQPVPRQRGIQIDWVGAVLAAISVILISLGFNNLTAWGVILAKPEAPISLFGLSPAPLMILVGVVVGQAFFRWSHDRQLLGRSPLMALEVLDSPEERNATFSLLIMSAVGPAVNFLIPLYIQIVQGRTSLQTSVAVIPYTLAIFTSAVLIVRLYARYSPRQIGRIGFILVSIGLVVLAITIRNDWGTPSVILGLIILGLGEGSLLTLLFNVLVTSSPKELAGDVGALRGVANNLSTALGTAFASVMAVGLLSLFLSVSLAASAMVPAPLQAQLPLDNVNFVSNEQLVEVLRATDATQSQVNELVAINAAARLRALKATFLILAGISLLAIFPAGGLPGYRPGEVPAGGADNPSEGRRPGRARRKPSAAG